MRPRDNPFAVERVHRLLAYRTVDTNLDALLIRLDELHRRAAIVGPRGHGKTTLLDALCPRLEAAGHCVWRTCLRAQPPRLPPSFFGETRAQAAAGAFLVIDGAEQLSSLRWWRLRRLAGRAAGLLITSHLPGRLPTLLQCRTSPALLANLVATLLADWSGPTPTPAELADLHRRHLGNLRACLRDLYDRYAELPNDVG